MRRKHDIDELRVWTAGTIEPRRGSPRGGEIVPTPTFPQDRAVAVASQVDGLEHAVPLDQLTLARTRGEWPQALCSSTVVPGALGARGRDCRICRHLVQATQRPKQSGRRRSWWRRLLLRY